MTAKSDRLTKLVEDPDLAAAFKAVRQKYFMLIEKSPLTDDTALLDIRKMLQLLRDVEHDLHTAIRDGKLEDFRATEQPGPLKELLNARTNEH